MEDEGHKIIKLNIGNIAAFGLEPPDEIVQDMIRNLPHTAGYTDRQGPVRAAQGGGALLARKSRFTASRSMTSTSGNGASELIVMSINALLNDGDEVAAAFTRLPALHRRGCALGRNAGALCLRRAIGLAAAISTTSRRRSRPAPGHRRHQSEQPTGALYPVEVLEQIVDVARKNELVVFADEIYDKTLYDGVTHTSIASLADDVLFVTFNGLSKNYRLRLPRGLDGGVGRTSPAKDYIEGLNMLASMRLCQHAGAVGDSNRAGGYQSIKDLVAPTGRLCRQRIWLTTCCRRSRV